MDSDPNEQIEQNRKLWNQLTHIHKTPAAARYYDIPAFKAGASTLRSIELDELGEVRGKSLLHLQCHLGLDTMSWARMGAEVTGTDLSDEAIAYARDLAAELDIPATFICCDLYDLSAHLERRYDIVFCSYGTTIWLPDLTRWAEIIAAALEPGGVFYIVDGHPFSMCLGNEDDPDVLRVVRSYFRGPEPELCEDGFDYADREAPVEGHSYEWNHTFAEIITALASAGLEIEFVHEFPYCDDAYLEGMERGEDGWYRLTNPDIRVPHSFSILARRPA